MTDRAKAAKYARPHKKSRRRPEFFAGRDDDLREATDDILNTLDPGFGDDCDPPDQDGVLLFTGPPGSGKTSLLKELRARTLREGIWKEPGTKQGGLWKALGRKLGMKPLFVLTTPQRLGSNRNLIDLCIATARGRGRDPMPEEIDRGIGLSYQDIRIDGVNVLTRWLGKAALAMRPAVVVMVDEAQNTRRSNAEAYDSLQNASTKYNFVPIFAGLSNARGRIQDEGGISRLRVNLVRRLTTTESEQAIRGALEKIGMSDDELARAAQEGATKADGYAAHVNSYTWAAAKHCSEREKPERPLTEEDWEAIAKLARERRDQHYYDRCANDKLGPIELAATARAIGDVTRGGADGVYELEEAAAEVRAKRKDENMTAQVLLEKLVHTGLLEERPEDPGTYREGIPSFTTWLKSKYLPQPGAPQP